MGTYVPLQNRKRPFLFNVDIIMEKIMYAQYFPEQLDWCNSIAIKNKFYISRAFKRVLENKTYGTFCFEDQADAALFKLYWG